MKTNTSSTASPAPGKAINISLWAAQILLALVFCLLGLWKLTAPIPDLAAAIKWPGEFPPSFVRIIGLIDLAGGLGVLLPALTRIQPGLTVLAALGCSILQVVAISFHLSRGEVQPLPLNAILLPLALFILWGRSRKAPIAPRR